MMPEDDFLLDEKERLLERIEGYVALGMRKEAIDECESLVRLDPDDPASIVELGIQSELDGEKALEHFKYGIEKFPQYFRTYVALGYWFERYRGRTDIAMLCYEKALDLNPDDEWAFYNIGRMLHYSGKWKEAISYYEQSYESCKREGLVVGRTLHGLAWAYYRLKDYKKASVLFGLIVQEDAGYLEQENDVRADFGCVQYKLGHYDKSSALFEEALKRQPANKRYKCLHNLAREKASLFAIKQAENPRNSI
jgi:tetratricopeptide (TPR) repeat protein